MPGLFDALQSGRSEEQYFALLKDKLEIDQSQLAHYIKKEMADLEEIKATAIEELKY